MAARALLACRWLALWCLLAGGAAQAQLHPLPDPPTVRAQLGPDSARWIAAHPVLRVGTTQAWAPVDSFAPDGRYEGISGSVLDRVARALGVRCETRRYADYREALAAIERGDIDVLPSIARSPEREQRLVFTRAYLQMKIALIARRGGTDLAVDTDLTGRRVAIERGYVLEEYLRREQPRAERIVAPDTVAALRAVADGTADVYLGLESPALHAVESERIAGLEIVGEPPLDAGSLHFATARRDAALRDALDAALAALGPETIAEIADAWEPRMLMLGRRGGAALTAAERAAVQAVGEVRVTFDGAFAPISWIDEAGQGDGYAIDLFDSIAKRLGLTYRYVPRRTFADALAALRSGEADVLLAAARTPERLAFADFVGPYYSAPSVIVTRLDGGWNSLGALSGRRLAIDGSHYLIPSVRRETPGVRIDEYPSVRRAMDAVARGDADAMVTNIEVAARLINSDFLGQLQVSGVVEGQPSELYFMLPAGRPELAAVLRRGLDAVPDSERTALAARWLRTSYVHGVPWTRIAAVGLPLAAMLLTVIGFVSVYNRRLRAEVGKRREAEAALARERDDAVAQAATKADFLATMGHEIRTPLAAISSGIELLQARLAGTEHVSLVGRMQRASRYLVRLLNDILDYAKLDAHRIALALEPVLLDRIAAEVVEEFEPLARSKGLALRFEARGDADLWVMSDPLRLRQVFANLIGNALKFTPAGKVEVQVEQAAAGARVHATARVADTGIGIRASGRDAIFEPYARVHDEKTRRIDGTGLGLAIVREIVQAMRGSIEVDSHIDQGSTFTLRFEFDRAGGPPAPAPDAGQAVLDDHSGQRVLVVDDDAVLRYMTAEQLESLGYAVSAAGSADEALALAARTRFDAVVTDLHLGQADGASLAARLRANAAGARPALLALTGDNSLEAAQACTEAGFDARLVKPVLIGELGATLARVLAASRHGTTPG